MLGLTNQASGFGDFISHDRSLWTLPEECSSQLRMLNKCFRSNHQDQDTSITCLVLVFQTNDEDHVQAASSKSESWSLQARHESGKGPQVTGMPIQHLHAFGSENSPTYSIVEWLLSAMPLHASSMLCRIRAWKAKPRAVFEDRLYAIGPCFLSNIDQDLIYAFYFFFFMQCRGRWLERREMATVL